MILCFRLFFSSLFSLSCLFLSINFIQATLSFSVSSINFSEHEDRNQCSMELTDMTSIKDRWERSREGKGREGKGVKAVCFFEWFESPII